MFENGGNSSLKLFIMNQFISITWKQRSKIYTSENILLNVKYFDINLFGQTLNSGKGTLTTEYTINILLN